MSIIIDGENREVNVYNDRNNATVASVYFVALNITDRVLAANIRNSFWENIDQGLEKAGIIGKGTVDLEKLAIYNINKEIT